MGNKYPGNSLPPTVTQVPEHLCRYAEYQQDI